MRTHRWCCNPQRCVTVRRFGDEGLSPEAVRGLAVATGAVGVDSVLLQEFLQGNAVTGARADLALKNLSTLKDVNGLEDMVTCLKNSKNNTTGIDGVIYESTVARELVDGYAGAGQLQRISADGIPGSNRIDTTTTNWAAQVKHKTAAGNLGVEPIGSSSIVPGTNPPLKGWEVYLNDMVAQTPAGKDTYLITNKQITGPLRDELSDRNIK